jgi:hypothetical protein
MTDDVDMPGMVAMPEFIEMDDGKWWLTEKVFDDPGLHRRLVRTQIEELVAVFLLYPLCELESVGQALHQLQQAYSKVAPFNHPTMVEEVRGSTWKPGSLENFPFPFACA